MAEIKKENTEHTNIENVGEALTRAEKFIEDNQKILTIIVIALIVVVGGYFLFKKTYLAPMEKEAHTQMFMAEQYFEKDSFNLALNGDGNNWGFVKIIDEYGLTNAANLAHYYAGISYLQTGRYQQAIDQLKKFSSSDKLVSRIATGAIGDAYLELGNKEKALDYYLKAANKHANDFSSPIYLMKAGGVCEMLVDYKQAYDVYKKIKEEYPMSFEARQIDKYIARTKILSGK